MRYFFILALIVFSIPKKQAFAEKCNAEFGSYIGQSYLTKAYSNCNEDDSKHETNFVLLKNTNRKIASGMKWQCVEYARRWLIENKNVTFADVIYAYSIWELKTGERTDTNLQVPLLKFKNKSSKTQPEIGDLLIYSANLYITGHVAVVVSVNDNSITIAEQNYFNELWDGASYSRRLLIEKDKKNKYRIFDDSLIGWVRFAS